MYEKRDRPGFREPGRAWKAVHREHSVHGAHKKDVFAPWTQETARGMRHFIDASRLYR